MKKSQIKLIMFLLLLISSFFLFIYFSFRSYNYNKEYKVDKYNVKEVYEKNSSTYKFFIYSGEEKYAYEIKNNYIRKKELINSIKITKGKYEICIMPESKYLEFYPLCYKNKETYTYNLSNKKMNFKYKKTDRMDKTYNKINLKYLNNNNFLFYNYRGFNFISDNKQKEIKLFNKDIYNLNLIYQFKNFLFTPNYNDDYFFSSAYIININNGKVEKMFFDYEISFDSVFLGDHKNRIYLLDRKNQKEYKINIKKKEIELTNFLILKDNKLEKTTYKRIIKDNLTFDKDNINSYIIRDNILYKIIDNIKIKISNKEVTKIVKETTEDVYYLSGEKLYMFNNMYGEVLLIENFEWNFNNTNMIYFYK